MQILKTPGYTKKRVHDESLQQYCLQTQKLEIAQSKLKDEQTKCRRTTHWNTVGSYKVLHSWMWWQAFNTSIQETEEGEAL